MAQPGTERRSEDLLDLSKDAVLFRGLGRSYGDSSLPPASRPVAGSTLLADRVLAFDESTGLLRAEAGLCLADLDPPWCARGDSSRPWCRARSS